jgi:formiminotetrahydrofolate cyclodeaminase
MTLMDPTVTTLTVYDFVQEVSGQQHAMAGAVIAVSAGQAAALGQACMQITRDAGPNHELQAIDGSGERLAQIKMELLQWSNRDATAIAEYVALREAGDPLAGQELLCSSPAEVCRIAIEAANILQEFRPRVVEKVGDDLEMAVRLLTGAAQAAMLLLDSNLRIWPEPALLAQFEAIQNELLAEIDCLSPATRIRK